MNREVDALKPRLMRVPRRRGDEPIGLRVGYEETGCSPQARG